MDASSSSEAVGRKDSFTLRAFRRLLAAYPADFRAEYGDDMIQVFGDELRGCTAAESAVVFARAVADLARTAPREHFAVRSAPAPAPAGGPALAPLPQRQAGSPGPTRRVFLRHALVAAGAGLGASMAGASLAYVWPSLRGSFGALVEIGTVDEIVQGVRTSGGTFAVPAARSYLVGYDPADDPDGMYADITAGLPFMALYQRCVHLGCRVPWCTSSTRFECPCHMSRYNRWGEFVGGPAPRGLDRFAIREVDGTVVVDTQTLVTGPARSGGVLAEEASGPSCLNL